MGKMLLCRDLGFDCDGIIHAKTENEIIRIASEHAAEIHEVEELTSCLLYTSDAADDTPCVDLGGRRIIKKIFFKQKTAYEI